MGQGVEARGGESVGVDAVRGMGVRCVKMGRVREGKLERMGRGKGEGGGEGGGGRSLFLFVYLGGQGCAHEASSPPDVGRITVRRSE